MHFLVAFWKIVCYIKYTINKRGQCKMLKQTQVNFTHSNNTNAVVVVNYITRNLTAANKAFLLKQLDKQYKNVTITSFIAC